MARFRNFAAGAIILTFAALIARVIGFVYRIYLSNLIGAEGIGLFQLISPVYALVILTLTSGISVAVSKMVASETARKNQLNPGEITLIALLVVITAGAAASLLILLNLHGIANSLLGDSRTYLSVLVLIPCIPIVAAASALKGYFYGMQNVMPPAISQIIEQFVRIALLFAAGPMLFKLGLEYACALATVCMAAGEVSNMLFLALLFAVKRKRRKKADNMLKGQARRKISIIRELIRISTPISINRFITSAMSAVEVILIPARLLAGGMDAKLSMELFGKLSGMAMPLIYFPSVVTSSLAVTLVPAISEALSLDNRRLMASRISKSIQVSFIIGFLFTVIFVMFPDSIGNMIYKKENIGSLLRMLAFSCTFLYLQQTLTGILNGLGKQGISLRNSVIGYSIRIAAVYFLIPVYGIDAYIFSIIFSTFAVCLLNLTATVKFTGMKPDIAGWLLKPALAGALVIYTGKYVQILVDSLFTGYTAGVLINVALSSFIFLGLGYLTGIPMDTGLRRLIKVR